VSEENIETLRRAWESFTTRDPSGLDYLDPDVVFEVGAEFLPDGGVFHGHDGFREVVGRWAGAWDAFRNEAVEFIDLGRDEAIVVSETAVRSKDTALEFEWEIAYLYKLRDGKIVHIRQARDRAQALRLAGGAES
jgi:ketosteroid isomerase-like protein